MSEQGPAEETEVQRRLRLLASTDPVERAEGLHMQSNDHLKAIRASLAFVVAVLLLGVAMGVVAVIVAASESSSSGY